MLAARPIGQKTLSSVLGCIVNLRERWETHRKRVQARRDGNSPLASMKLSRLFSIGNFFPGQKPHTGSGKKRPFPVVQIEVTSRCGTGCVFCPHDALSKKWIEWDLAIETYREQIAPHLDLFELVYLQGWGEPMLHPGLWEMIQIAKEKGCRTGFTTNGTWLDEEHNQKILDMGVDLISVSFAGTTASLHEALRTHSDFSQLCSNFQSLANLKKQSGCEHPWLELHFLMTRINLKDLPVLVELAASLGADEIVATNLTYSPSLELDKMHVFSEPPLPIDVEIICQAKETAARLKVPLRAYPLQTEPNTLVCDANPVNTIFINHRGEVTPCVYLGLTVLGAVPRYFYGESHPFKTISFGNIQDGLLPALHGKEREAFVNQFVRRNMNGAPFAVLNYLSGPSGESEIPAPPMPCQHCYKMLGI
jgi:MoaA/NifB/PqqE/SkfB family radical SAM enzyme